MKLLNAMFPSLVFLASMSPCISQVASAQNSQTINITERGSRQFSKASAQNFTGSVRIEPVFDAHDPSRATGGRVRFEPGARTAWHTHPAQQAKVTSLMSKDLTEIPGREVLMITVEYAPGGVDPIHRHNAHAFVYVLEGSIVMQ